MKKRLGEFTLDEIRAECDRYETMCYGCAFWKDVYGCFVNPRRRKSLDMEIEIADAEEEK